MQHENRRVVKREVKSEMEQLVDLVCEEARPASKYKKVLKYGYTEHGTLWWALIFEAPKMTGMNKKHAADKRILLACGT